MSQLSLKQDQNNPSVRKQFVEELKTIIDKQLTNNQLLQFSLNYGFTLENAFRAVQEALDNGLLDAELVDDNILFITHRQCFKAPLSEQQRAQFDEEVENEIKRLEQEYEKVNATGKFKDPVQEVVRTNNPFKKTQGNSKIIPRQRMRMN